MKVLYGPDMGNRQALQAVKQAQAHIGDGSRNIYVGSRIAGEQVRSD